MFHFIAQKAVALGVSADENAVYNETSVEREQQEQQEWWTDLRFHTQKSVPSQLKSSSFALVTELTERMDEVTSFIFNSNSRWRSERRTLSY